MRNVTSVFLVIGLVLCTSCASTADEDIPPTASESAAAELLQQGKHQEALEAFSKIAYEGQGSPRSLVGMALCYAYTGQRGRFEVFALEAAAQSPHTIGSHYRMGVMYVQAAERFRQYSGGYRYAQLGIEYLRRVFAAQPEYHLDLVPTLGLGLHLGGDDRGAVLMLEETVRRYPKRVDSLHTLLLCYRNLGNKGRVKELLEPWSKSSELPPAWKSLLNWATT